MDLTDRTLTVLQETLNCTVIVTYARRSLRTVRIREFCVLWIIENFVCCGYKEFCVLWVIEICCGLWTQIIFVLWIIENLWGVVGTKDFV